MQRIKLEYERGKKNARTQRKSTKSEWNLISGYLFESVIAAAALPSACVWVRIASIRYQTMSLFENGIQFWQIKTNPGEIHPKSTRPNWNLPSANWNCSLPTEYWECLCYFLCDACFGYRHTHQRQLLHFMEFLSYKCLIVLFDVQCMCVWACPCMTQAFLRPNKCDSIRRNWRYPVTTWNVINDA